RGPGDDIEGSTIIFSEKFNYLLSTFEIHGEKKDKVDYVSLLDHSWPLSAKIRQGPYECETFKAWSFYPCWFELKECTEVSNVIKHLLEGDLPYSVALKVEFKLVRKSVGIRTPLMAAIDDTTWKEGARFGNEVLYSEITTGRKNVVGYVLELEFDTRNAKGESELIDHDGPHLGTGPINDSNGAQECKVQNLEEKLQPTKRWKRLARSANLEQGSRVLTHGKCKEECEFFSEVAFPSYDTTGSKKVKGAREEVNNFMMDNFDKNALEQALALTNEGSTAANGQANRAQ
ncbi:hypothetical protein Goshw_027824, partial [Gossypium schwendimanii]|nr:hypothetical protein [Gossypium schwendimanii]